MDLLIELKCFLVGAHAPITAGYHELPLHFGRLDLCGAAEEMDRALIQFALNVPDWARRR